MNRLKSSSLRRQKGLTLIEILVVLLIISIITGVAVLSIGRNQGHSVETFANSLSQSIALAQERAILQQKTLGILMTRERVEFDWYNTDAEGQVPDWQPLDDGAFISYTVPRGLTMILEVGGKSARLPVNTRDLKPQIIISNTGDLTPFNLYLGEEGRSPLYQLKGEEDGSLEVIKR